MQRFADRLAAFVKGLSAWQRISLLGGGGIVALTVWIFVRLMGGGDYKPLYTNLASADVPNLTQRLAAQSIQYQVSSDGTTVLVPSDQMDRARLSVASQGPLSSGRMGFELFDKPNWSGSDFSEKVNYQRALEGELERTIQTMNGVEAVRVHLVLPHDSLFSDRERPAKAAVVLKLTGTRLSDSIVRSTQNLVASAWDDLSPENVTVVTTGGEMTGGGRSREAGGVSGMEDLETAMAEKVVQVLTPVVGADHVKSSVTIEYDPTSGETTQELYDPNAAAVLSSQTSEESAGDLRPSGIPGTPSNVPNAPPAGAAAHENKTTERTEGIRSESKTFAVSRTTHHLLEPAGRIKRVAAAVLVDDVVEQAGKPNEKRRKRTPEEMKQIEGLIRAALGLDSSRGDMLSVENATFQRVEVDNPAPPTTTERIEILTERWTGLLHYLALFAAFILVYYLLLRPVKNQMLAILKAPGPKLTAARAPALATGAAVPAMEPAGELLEAAAPAGASAEVNRAVQLKRELSSKVKMDPQGASRLIENWLREGEHKK